VRVHPVSGVSAPAGNTGCGAYAGTGPRFGKPPLVRGESDWARLAGDVFRLSTCAVAHNQVGVTASSPAHSETPPHRWRSRFPSRPRSGLTSLTVGELGTWWQDSNPSGSPTMLHAQTGVGPRCRNDTKSDGGVRGIGLSTDGLSRHTDRPRRESPWCASLRGQSDHRLGSQAPLSWMRPQSRDVDSMNGQNGELSAGSLSRGS
jgi:hypothetical protein